ncbi:hypothetical protein AAFF_G00197620 [Aldrovandia affinis]|uniref:SAM-dependent MTase RsmB/NOP-type domain-containing protein n=1 Tax=Aldrovandia affinis TaxID=143900 RepID=A0AAD7W5U1_9TELE|nr:hypothetical protein AAFF_G00197620 [Aldrovandia affinis]
MYREENEEVVRKVLEQGAESPKQQLFRLTAPGLPPHSMPKEGNDKDKFFKMDPSEDNNGCFMAVLTREVPGETVQGILARAAATGLLDGIGPKQPPKKEKRRRRTRAAVTCLPAHPPAHPRASIGRLQSRIDQFLSQEAEGVTSQPAVALQASGAGDSLSKGARKSKSKGPHRQSLPKSITLNASTSPTQNNISAVNNTARRLGHQWSSKRAPGMAKTSLAGPSMTPTLSTSRQEALRPMEMILPPVAFPSLSSISSSKSTLSPPYQSPALSSHSLRAGSKTSLSLSSSSSLSRDRASAVWHPRPWH